MRKYNTIDSLFNNSKEDIELFKILVLQNLHTSEISDFKQYFLTNYEFYKKLGNFNSFRFILIGYCCIGLKKIPNSLREYGYQPIGSTKFRSQIDELIADYKKEKKQKLVIQIGVVLLCWVDCLVLYFLIKM